jgi:hypothetical protein
MAIKTQQALMELIEIVVLDNHNGPPRPTPSLSFLCSSVARRPCLTPVPPPPCAQLASPLPDFVALVWGITPTEFSFAVYEV